MVARQGRHFYEVHARGLDLTNKEGLAQCLENFTLPVIATVRPPATPEEEPAFRLRLDRFKSDMQHRLRCMQEMKTAEKEISNIILSMYGYVSTG